MPNENGSSGTAGRWRGRTTAAQKQLSSGYHEREVRGSNCGSSGDRLCCNQRLRVALKRRGACLAAVCFSVSLSLCHYCATAHSRCGRTQSRCAVCAPIDGSAPRHTQLLADVQNICAHALASQRPQTWGERAEEAKPAASIGTMSASPPKADKPITLAKPESPTVSPVHRLSQWLPQSTPPSRNLLSC
jgi:hypothetical protein